MCAKAGSASVGVSGPGLRRGKEERAVEDPGDDAVSPLSEYLEIVSRFSSMRSATSGDMRWLSGAGDAAAARMLGSATFDAGAVCTCSGSGVPITERLFLLALIVADTSSTSHQIQQPHSSLQTSSYRLAK